MRPRNSIRATTGISSASQFDTGDNRYIFIGGIDTLEVTNLSGNWIELSRYTTVRYPTAILSDAACAGNIDITVVDATGLEAGDVLSLGTETIIITDVSTSTLTVDTDPETAGNQGIMGDYPVGAIINPIPVFRVTAVEYAINDDGNLTREDKAVGTVAELAGNIQNIEVFPDTEDDRPSYGVKLTAQTKNPDAHYADNYGHRLTAQTKNPDAHYADNYGHRQRVLESTVALRNL